MGDRTVTVERIVHAPAEAVFDLLADPAGQARIDGSGTVKGVRGESRRLKLGDTFTMQMRIGLPYPSPNKVIELEENRRIAWRQAWGGQVWRYELEPVEGGTRVRETFDGTHYLGRWLFGPLGVLDKNRKGMAATLDRIEDLVGKGAA